MRSNSRQLIGLLLILATLTGGCTTQVRRAEPIKVELPEAKPQQRQFNAGTRQAFEQAVNLLRDGELELATVALQDLLQQREDIPGAWYNLALAQYHQQQLGAALQSLQRCIDLNPRHAPAHTLSGLIYREQAQFEQARIAYAKALESDKDYAQAHLNLAILYDIYLSYLEDARLHYQRYLELDKSSPQSEQVKLWLQDLQLRIEQERRG
jgi:tetratricopeptide (TPR) repeat protein